MNRKDFEIEICAGNIESVLAADMGGADRVELCENLFEGGTTPSFGSIVLSKEKCSLDVFVIIRARGGDFVYSEPEFEALDTIKSLGVKRILTSGQKNKAEEGIELIRKLQENAGTNLRIMVGSGINESNIQKISSSTGVNSFHASLREHVEIKNFKISSAQRVKALIKKIEEL